MRRPTGKVSHAGARRQERRYVRVVDAETQRSARLVVERERGRDFTKVIVHHPDWVRQGNDTFVKTEVVDNPENVDAIAMLVLAGGPEVATWLNENANGDVRRETFQVPAVNARHWLTMHAPKNMFLHAILPRVRHRLSFHEIDERKCRAAEEDEAAVRYQRRVVRASTGHVSVTFVTTVSKGTQESIVMYRKDDPPQLPLLNAVNCYAWRALIQQQVVHANTLEAAPMYVRIPSNRASEWTFENVERKFEDLRALLAAGVTFEEINE